MTGDLFESGRFAQVLLYMAFRSCVDVSQRLHADLVYISGPGFVLLKSVCPFQEGYHLMLVFIKSSFLSLFAILVTIYLDGVGTHQTSVNTI